jgi:hypothetical protein
MSEDCKQEENVSDTIEEINCETVDEVFSDLDKSRRDCPDVVYRGVKDAKYDLRPTLWRKEGEIYNAKKAFYKKNYN